MFKTKFYVNLMKEDRNWCNEMSMNTYAAGRSLEKRTPFQTLTVRLCEPY